MRIASCTLGTSIARTRAMFLKRSIGGHHVLVRIALGLVVACAVALAAFVVAGLARDMAP